MEMKMGVAVEVKMEMEVVRSLVVLFCRCAFDKELVSRAYTQVCVHPMRPTKPAH